MREVRVESVPTSALFRRYDMATGPFGGFAASVEAAAFSSCSVCRCPVRSLVQWLSVH